MNEILAQIPCLRSIILGGKITLRRIFLCLAAAYTLVTQIVHACVLSNSFGRLYACKKVHIYSYMLLLNRIWL